MISSDEFRSAFWADGLWMFDAVAVKALPLRVEEAEWLVNVGLPQSAAPFLDFGGKLVADLPMLEDMLRGAHGLPEVKRYCVIGGNGSGDPVALDLNENGAVVYLNHDNRFQRVLINSSVRQLAGCLAAYSKLVSGARTAGGHKAFLEGNLPEALVESFRSYVLETDPSALRNGTMWDEETRSLSGHSHAQAKQSWWRRLLGALRKP